MNEFDFLCGGDHGAWDCIVTVALTDDQVMRLKAYARKNDTLWVDEEVADIYDAVSQALIEQCVGSYDPDYIEEIWDDYAESEDDTEEDIVGRLLGAEGYVIWVPHDLREEE